MNYILLEFDNLKVLCDKITDYGLAFILVIIVSILLFYLYSKRKKINIVNKWFMNKIKMTPQYRFDKDSVKSKTCSPDKQNKEIIENLSIVASGTMSNKPVGQDACKNIFVENGKAHIVAVADGLGSHPHAEKGSRFVVDKAVELLESALMSGNDRIDFDEVFKQIQGALDKHIEQLLPKLPDSDKLIPEECFGTTLIVGIDYPDRFVAAYVGNGAIFNISGYFAEFPPVIYLPWNAINMLNPHTVEQDGREALYKLFSWKGKTYSPTVFEIQKNRDIPGEIFVLTTDGVYSSDHSIPGKDSEGAIWIPSSITTERLFEFLKDYLLQSSISESSLEQAIKIKYLSELKRNKEMDDCTTVGIIITEKCYDYFRNKRKNLNTKQ
jgi:serine/threonine protein phosphatase PrpC